MLAECSAVSISIDLNAIPKPEGVALERWLLTFPSFGYLLCVKPAHVAETIARFAGRGIAAASIGSVARGSRLIISDGAASETIWDFAEKPLIGAGGRARLAMGAVA
jgi:selenophosphate synthetase-related protein